MARMLEDTIQLEVKASLHVDEQTFDLCMGLIRVFAKEKGIKEALIRFDDEFGRGWEFVAIEDVEQGTCPLCRKKVE